MYGQPQGGRMSPAHDLGVEGAKVALPVGLSGAMWLGLTPEQWVTTLTLIYLVGLLIHQFCKHFLALCAAWERFKTWRSSKAKRRKARQGRRQGGVAKIKVLGGLTLASASLLAFLGLWEGEGQNTVYADKLAGGLPTVCKGITPYTSSKPMAVGDVWTDEECEQEERRIVEQTQIYLDECLSVEVSQNTFDALSSHAHNFGWPKTCGSYSVRLINDGRLADGCRALAWKPNGAANWSYVGGAYVLGLHKRRLAEMELCLTPDKPDQSQGGTVW